MGLMRFKIEMTCDCGHILEVECILKELGQAPIVCPSCQLHFLFRHIEAPRLRIICDPRLPEDEMIQIVGEDDNKPKVH